MLRSQGYALIKQKITQGSRIKQVIKQVILSKLSSQNADRSNIIRK